MLLEHPAGPETGQFTPALRLEEVSFTAYYPASLSPGMAKSRQPSWLDWVPRPLADAVRGYSRFSGISAFILWPVFLFFGSRIQVPAFLNAAPLRKDSKSPVDLVSAPAIKDQSTPYRWPLVIFSHGLGGGGTTYSQLCTHLASSGKVVLAIEHRDGTSPICRPRSEQTGKRYSLPYINPREVVRDAGGCNDPVFAFRAEQLEFRKHEIYLAYSAFRKLVMTGERGDLRSMDELPLDWESWTGDWVRCDEGVSLVGHSFGGATVFTVLSEPSPKGMGVSRIPISHGLVLDPWLEPLPSPDPEPFIDQPREAGHPKLMVINAEGFTLWKVHFKRVEGIVQAWSGSVLVTLVGGRHDSFSDIPSMLPIPIRSSTARPILNVIKTLALSFLDDRLPQTICNLNIRKLEVKDDSSWSWASKPKQGLVGQPGDVVIHRGGLDI